MAGFARDDGEYARDAKQMFGDEEDGHDSDGEDRDLNRRISVALVIPQPSAREERTDEAKGGPARLPSCSAPSKNDF